MSQPLCCRCHNGPRSSGMYCRPCRKDYNAAYRATRVNRAPTSDDMSGPELPDTGGAPAEHLYIMCYDGLGIEALKVGHAADVEARARTVDAGHNFRLRVLATFAGLGDLEPRVHGLHAHNRASGGRGREWFEVSLDTTLHAAALALRLGRG